MSFIKRNLVIDIDGTVVRDPMKITTTVAKDIDSNEPDFAQITIMNLGEGSRSKFAESKRVAIYAGYGEQEDLVFLGDVQSVTSTRANTEWVTVIIAGDGATAMKQAIVNKTYSEPISNKQLIEDLVAVSGLSDLPVEFIDVGDEVEILRGITVNGSVKEELTEITQTAGLDWNIQDDAVVVSKKDSARAPEAYLISIGTGMVGSPEWVNSGEDLTGKKPKDGYRLKVKSLCLPSVKPNDKVKVVSESIEGRIGSFSYKNDVDDTVNDQFKVLTVDHSLDSREGEFTTTLEVRVL